METEDLKNIIIDVLQSSLKGKIKDKKSINPQKIAEAITKKYEFVKPTINLVTKKEFNNSVIFFISALKSEMNMEIEKLNEDQLLLKNFINGQLTAAEKFEEFVKSMGLIF